MKKQPTKYMTPQITTLISECHKHYGHLSNEEKAVKLAPLVKDFLDGTADFIPMFLVSNVLLNDRETVKFITENIPKERLHEVATEWDGAEYDRFKRSPDLALLWECLGINARLAA